MKVVACVYVNQEASQEVSTHGLMSFD